jgi:hypothetical protein
MGIFCTLPGLVKMAFLLGRGCGHRRFPRDSADGGTSNCERVLRGHGQPAPDSPGARISRGGVRMETHHMIARLLVGLMTLWLA